MFGLVKWLLHNGHVIRPQFIHLSKQALWKKWSQFNSLTSSPSSILHKHIAHSFDDSSKLSCLKRVTLSSLCSWSWGAFRIITSEIIVISTRFERMIERGQHYMSISIGKIWNLCNLVPLIVEKFVMLF